MTTTKIRSSSQLFIDADLDLGTHKIINAVTPTASTDLATKGYVDGILGTNDAMLYKGVIDASANPNYPAADAGHTYKVSVAGKVGGASGTSVVAGDLVICTADATASGTQAAVGAYWDVIHVNASAGTVTSSSGSSVDNSIVRMDLTSGTIVQTSLAIVDDSGSINVPAGQSYKVNGTALVSNITHTGDVTDTAGSLAVNKINGVSMAGLATGILKNTTTTGVPSIAVAGTDYVVPGGALGTPSSGTLTNATGLPISGIAGLGTGVGTFLATPSSANLAAALTDETGTSHVVFDTSPTLITPNLGTPTTLVGTNITGTASGLTAGTVTTNANLTGEVTSVGNATTVTNAAVIAKVLTGYSAGAGTVSATDSILAAIQKLDGNDGLKQAISARDASGGYAGLTLFKVNMRNVANTYTSFLTNTNSAARTYTFPDKDGTVAMTSDIATVITREAPSGTKNGVNATFTLANTPITGSEHLYLNGVLLNQGAGNDYTISGVTITMLVLPISTDIMLCSYRY